MDWFGVAAFLSTGDYQSVAGNAKQDSSNAKQDSTNCYSMSYCKVYL